jgi:hypothetical protein
VIQSSSSTFDQRSLLTAVLLAAFAAKVFGGRLSPGPCDTPSLVVSHEEHDRRILASLAGRMPVWSRPPDTKLYVSAPKIPLPQNTKHADIYVCVLESLSRSDCVGRQPHTGVLNSAGDKYVRNDLSVLVVEIQIHQSRIQILCEPI